MIDLSHIPKNHLRTQIFYAQGSNKWQTWIKPKSAKFVHVFACAGGGGGGGAGTGNNTLSRAGAGGGGSSGFVHFILPVNLVPDILYLLVGSGGAGGAGTTGTGTTVGTAGNITYISLRASTASADLYYNINPGNGAGGAAGGTAGGTPTVSDLAQFANATILSGQAGATRVAGAAGAGVVTTGILSGGGSGGSLAPSALTFTAGGSITGGFITINGGQTDGADGDPGFIRDPLLISTKYPFFLTGGGGGASTLTTAIGGRGGDGAWGCGGGGGGASSGTSPITGGRGGKGGDGIVVITSF